MDYAASAGHFLNDAAVRQNILGEYKALGCAILTDMFDAPELKTMNATWERISEERRTIGKKPFLTLLVPHISYPEVRKITVHPALIRVLEFFLDGKIELIQSQLMHGMPGTKGFSPHQDNYYNRAEPMDGIIAVWIALEDVDVSNGGVAVYPRSHTSGLVKTHRDWLYLISRAPDIVKSLVRLLIPRLRAQSADSGVIERFVHAAPGAAIVPVVHALKAGSVLLMHGNLVHSSGPNTTPDRHRRSLLANYVRKGTHYSAGRLSGRVSMDVYAEGS